MFQGRQYIMKLRFSTIHTCSALMEYKFCLWTFHFLDCKMSPKEHIFSTQLCIASYIEGTWLRISQFSIWCSKKQTAINKNIHNVPEPWKINRFQTQTWYAKRFTLILSILKTFINQKLFNVISVIGLNGTRAAAIFSEDTDCREDVKLVITTM